MDEAKLKKLVDGSIKWFGIAVLVLVLLFSSVTIVKPGQRGVLVSLGKMSNTELGPGPHFHVPFFTSIRKVSVQPVQVDFTIPVDDNGGITKDSQIVGGKVTVFYTYSPGKIADMLSNFGEDQVKSFVKTYIEGSFKVVAGKYTILEFATLQDSITTAVADYFKTKLSAVPVNFVSLAIVNYNWGKAYDAQIDALMTKKMDLEKAKQDLAISETKSQTQVKEAEARSTATKLDADASAYKVKQAADANKYADIAAAEAKKKANELMAATFPMEVKLQELAIARTEASRWDGRRVYENKIMPYPIAGYPAVAAPAPAKQ